MCHAMITDAHQSARHSREARRCAAEVDTGIKHVVWCSLSRAGYLWNGHADSQDCIAKDRYAVRCSLTHASPGSTADARKGEQPK